MSLAQAPLVGSPRSRAVRGGSAGARAVLLGTPPSDTHGSVATALGELDITVDPRLAAVPPPTLANLAEVLASEADMAVVLAAGDLEISAVALLDLLDAPVDLTAAAVLPPAALVGRGARPFAMVRTGPHDRLVHSASSARHITSNPTSYAAGILRVSAADRGTAAVALLAAAASTPDSPATIDDVLVALVRFGVPVRAVELGPYSITRGSVTTVAAPGSPWEQRLRGSSRGNDGAFSMAVVRPISRRVTRLGLSLDWHPNAVTAASFALGVAACVLTATGNRWAWVAAAVLLQLSLVVDCVDGEIARFTRRYSQFGGWLDAVSDRVKEFAMVGAVAWVAAARGGQLWWLATLLLGLLAVRHVEDYAYASRTRARSAGVGPDLLAFGAPTDLGGAGTATDRTTDPVRTTVPDPPQGRARVVQVVKQVLHLPIAERYLIMSLALLTFSPAVFLWTLVVAATIALSWTTLGRTARALTGRDRAPTDGDPRLAKLTDLGPLSALAPRGTGRLAWQVPGLLVALEAVVLAVVAARAPGESGAAAYVLLAAVCWHHYDTIYRVRETGEGPARWVSLLSLGAPLRIAAVLLVAWAGALDPTLWWAALILFVAYAMESALGWRSRSVDAEKVTGRVDPVADLGQDEAL